MGSGSPPLGLDPGQAIFRSPQRPDPEHSGCRPVRGAAGPVPGPECAGGVQGEWRASPSLERPTRRCRKAAVEKAGHPSLAGSLWSPASKVPEVILRESCLKRAKCESYLSAPRTLAPLPLLFTGPSCGLGSVPHPRGSPRGAPHESEDTARLSRPGSRPAGT